MERVILAAVGAAFVALGRVLPRLRFRFWTGIRTPWTLVSESVWRETHRLAGRTFTAGGVLTIVAALLPPPWRLGLAIVALLIAGFVPALYSWLAWRRELSGPTES